MAKVIEVYRKTFLDDGRVEISSNIPEVGGTYEDAERAIIETGLQQLKYFQKMDTSLKPGELAWEIKLYYWMLNHRDSKRIIKQYLLTRSQHDGKLLPKRECVKQLGWSIDGTDANGIN